MVDLNRELYTQKGYLNKDRWVSYAQQTSLVQRYLKADHKILEIGVGNEIVTDFLKQNFKLTTVDINSELNPDIVASVENLSKLKDVSFDSVLCAEVLEHLPYEKFEKSLKELIRVTKRYIIISLPFWGYTFGVKIRLPKIGTKVFKFKINGFKKHDQSNSAGHYWEMGKKGCPVKKIKNIYKKNNLKIIKSFWDIDDPYHYYFVLKK